jgi:hypothetical protein
MRHCATSSLSKLFRIEHRFESAATCLANTLRIVGSMLGARYQGQRAAMAM